MRGFILTELEKFVVQQRGLNAWRDVAARAGLATKAYLPSATYPDPSGDKPDYVGRRAEERLRSMFG